MACHLARAVRSGCERGYIGLFAPGQGSAACGLVRLRRSEPRQWYVPRLADPPRSQPRSRRRLHVLGADDRPRRHPRLRRSSSTRPTSRRSTSGRAPAASTSRRSRSPRTPTCRTTTSSCPHGSSMGTGYGPIVVTREQVTRRGAPREGGRRPRGADDRVPHASPLHGRLRLPRDGVRGDPRPRSPPDGRRPGS